MRYLYTAFGFFLFLLVLGFALKNADLITLHYYLGFSWQAPLSLTLLIAFIVGVVAALIACSSLLISQRRHLTGLQRELDRLQARQE